MSLDKESQKRDSTTAHPSEQHVENASTARNEGATLNSSAEKVPSNAVTGGKRELKEADAYEHLGYCYPTWKKWGILTISKRLLTPIHRRVL